MSPEPSYQLPAAIPGELAQILNYWTELKRAGNEIPFADDVDLPALGPLSGQVLLVDVFENPLRLRFGPTGRRIIERYGDQVEGEFSDEIAARVPFDEFTPQARITVESRAPSYFEGPSAYSRLLLPLWGDGHVAMLLGGIAWT